jgi:hypothetical protein
MAKVVNLKVHRTIRNAHRKTKIQETELKQDEPISTATYIEMADTIESLIAEARPDRLEGAVQILHQIRWNASFNPFFREGTKTELEQIMLELYAETQQ